MPSGSTPGLPHPAHDAGSRKDWAGSLFIVTLVVAVLSGAYVSTQKLHAPVPPVRWSEQPSNTVPANCVFSQGEGVEFQRQCPQFTPRTI